MTPCKLLSNQLPHIDNNFYRLTPKQASDLAVGGSLPLPGYERRADTAKLANYVLGKITPPPSYAPEEEAATFTPFPTRGPVAKAWIVRTPLSWFNGKEVLNRVVWALHISS